MRWLKPKSRFSPAIWEILDARVKALMYDGGGRLRRFSGLEPDEVISALGVAFELQLCTTKAFQQRYPITIHGGAPSGSTECADAESFALKLKAELEILEPTVNDLQRRAEENRRSADRVLAASIKNLVTVSETALFEKAEEEVGFEENRMSALAAMKDLGGAFDAVRGLVPDRPLGELWKAVDTIYGYLTKPTVPQDVWTGAKTAALTALRVYETEVQARDAPV